MGRKARYDVDQLLDCAAALACEHGPAGVSMVAVARRSGAPSGSVYHRFPDRPALLAALWTRSVRRFQQGYLEALADGGADGLVAGARHIVSWCRGNPVDARILRWGADDFDRAQWSEVDRRALEAANEAVFARIGEVAVALGACGERAREQVVLAAVEVPYAVVRRHLRSGGLPDHAEELAATSCRALLAAL